MKRLLLFAAILCCGCNNNEDGKEWIETLADSITNYIGSMEGEWSFDGSEIELSGTHPFSTNSYIFIQPAGALGTSVSMKCEIWDENDDSSSPPAYWVSIGNIFLSGEPGDVTFDDNVDVVFAERRDDISKVEYMPVRTHITGWIKHDTKPATRLSFSRPSFHCDIRIECEIDGKPLKLHITRINN